MDEIEDEHDVSVSSPLAFRYKQWYLGMPCRLFHLFILAATMLLIGVTIIEKTAHQLWWYHVFEFAVMVLFVGEVGTSVYFLRQRYFDEWLNRLEFLICVLCTISYLAVVFHIATGNEEHELLLGLRYVGQLLRLTMFARLAVAESRIGGGSQKQMSEVRPQLITKDDSDNEEFNPRTSGGPETPPNGNLVTPPSSTTVATGRSFTRHGSSASY